MTTDDLKSTFTLTCPRHYEVSVSATLGQAQVTLTLDWEAAEDIINRLCEAFGEERIRAVVDTP
jgi:hypothetical protein